MNNHGGKRKNSGRPGAVAALKRKIQDYFTEAEVIKLIKDIKKDPRMKGFLVEQLFGKAPQRIEMTGADGDPIVIQISKETAERYGIKSTQPTSSTKPDS